MTLEKIFESPRKIGESSIMRAKNAVWAKSLSKNPGRENLTIWDIKIKAVALKTKTAKEKLNTADPKSSSDHSFFSPNFFKNIGIIAVDAVKSSMKV